MKNAAQNKQILSAPGFVKSESENTKTKMVFRTSPQKATQGSFKILKKKQKKKELTSSDRVLNKCRFLETTEDPSTVTTESTTEEPQVTGSTNAPTTNPQEQSINIEISLKMISFRYIQERIESK